MTVAVLNSTLSSMRANFRGNLSQPFYEVYMAYRMACKEIGATPLLYGAAVGAVESQLNTYALYPIAGGVDGISWLR